MAGDLTGERWLEREERNREIDHIIEVLERWTLQHTVAELEEKGQLMHFPWAGVRSVSQLLKCQHLRTREYFTDIEVADSGQRYRAPGAAVKMGCSPWKAGGRVARPGEHNAEIYLRELGLPESDYKTLSEEGVI
jgi:crotonobetainyl-CoA:carnitine CoA-transferase CaiB-like acyl-CoA transferase